MMLTEHFADYELDVQGAEQRIQDNAKILCRDLLEPIRVKVGPILIHDGYRPPQHNQEVGGVQNSFHLYNEDQAAADFSPESYNLRQAFDWIRLGSKLNFDKVILELNKQTLVPSAIHIQYFTLNVSQNRREAYEGFTFGQGDYTKVKVI